MQVDEVVRLRKYLEERVYRGVRDALFEYRSEELLSRYAPLCQIISMLRDMEGEDVQK